MMLFTCPRIHAERGLVDGYVLVDGGRIAAVGAGPVPASLEGVERVDLPDCHLIPGMIDLHIHGAGGWPVEPAGVEGLQALGRYLAAFGVTGFLPSASAYPLADLESLAGRVRAATGVAYDGAAILGLHLEGPYLSPRRPGAMHLENLRTPSVSEAERLLAAGGGTVRRISLAPELPGALDLIRYLARNGVTVAGAHTDATYEETLAGIDAGVRLATHTYNAMRGLHHREPGALGAYLTDERVTCEFIGDLLHVHPACVKLLLRAVGYERLCLISDAIPAAGLSPGHYRLWGRDLYIDEEGFSRLADGTIAGSTKLMLHGLRNLVEKLGVPWEQVVRMAALNPARVIGISDRKGSLAPGKDADLVAVGPDWQVRWTVVEGRVVRRPGDPPPALNPEYVAARA
ncbi:MAG: N-acetylglucosamine-6-phosphate deacetylase [Symbiobacterium sp.]|uniref:N-acetylglucosamine-6-phosphate deacetylase n=1 Tax=Symbiobacterium sp. TaxID=1971213 RepID=UPI003464A3A0